MIKVKKSGDGTVATVSGSECEVMLFYCIWQSHLWADWMWHDNLGVEGDAATRQHQRVIQDINAGRGILLNNQGKEFHVALDFAVTRFRRLGIDVDEMQCEQEVNQA